jgi:uncharacterized protein YjiS (DUF1127 family)
VIAQTQPRRAEGPGLVGALDLVLTWIERAKQRAELASLELHALHDLGLSNADRESECGKHFWQR